MASLKLKFAMQFEYTKHFTIIYHKIRIYYICPGSFGYEEGQTAECEHYLVTLGEVISLYYTGALVYKFFHCKVQ